MTKVVPSQVVQFIAGAFPPDVRQSLSIGFMHAPHVRALVSLIEAVPPELMVFDQSALPRVLLAIARLRQILADWNREPRSNLNSPPNEPNPIAFLHLAFTQLPDRQPAISSTAFQFVTDAQFRHELLTDAGEVSRALASGEWKASTVLAGAVLEALLLWDLQQRASAALGASKAPKDRGNPIDLDRWGLQGLIDVAEELGRLQPTTVAAARLCQGFRSLIHPGRMQRLAQQCDRGTALAASAAIEFVARDLA